MNDNIEAYMDRGEINYIGKVDSTFTLSGKERIVFKWKMNADPRIENCVIYWNNNRDSVRFRISDLVMDESGYFSAEIPIAEGTYIFSMYHTGSKGHRSVREELTGRSYGALFEQTLTNRILESAFFDGKDLTLRWMTSGTAVTTVTGIRVTYTDTGGKIQTYLFDLSDKEMFIPDFDISKPLCYSTQHLPELAVDKFFAPTIEKMIDPVVEIPKKTWNEYILPTDFEINSWYTMSKMWDNIFDEFCMTEGNYTSLPLWFTWDMGVKAKLSRMKVWPRYDSDYDKWRDGHAKKFELYGSLEEPNADGSWDGWTLLGRFECVNPKPEVTTPWTDPELMDLARAGFDFNFTPDELAGPSAPVRYIRLKVTDVFDYVPTVYFRIMFSQITFWGEMVR
jgi:hypothetical protein